MKKSLTHLLSLSWLYEIFHSAENLLVKGLLFFFFIIIITVFVVTVTNLHEHICTNRPFLNQKIPRFDFLGKLIQKHFQQVPHLFFFLDCTGASILTRCKPAVNFVFFFTPFSFFKQLLSSYRSAHYSLTESIIFKCTEVCHV